MTRRERVVPRLIEDEMRESFLDYSMSVIVQRALPDVRDGLKPVHRRILYAMYEGGLSAGRPYKKSATVVGDVLGKYHPHGDMSVYDALVRMVQDFSLRYPLIDGQGNFGSIDGDNAAAYRYTETRLTPLAMALLADIDRETVDLAPNFDDRLREPTVLPARFPNLLANGSSGIAVGMATNIPPHNLRELAAAVHQLVDDPDCSLADLMRHVPGPDFPTGAYILGTAGIRDAYDTGRGRMIMRAAVQKEAKRGGREQLVVTALPFGISKTRVIEQIADLVRNRKTEDIAELRDESDRDGMRIVVELKRGVQPAPLLALLYKQTYLQATFGAIMLSLDHGVPRELSLKQMLERFRDHRLEVIRRRAEHDLADALDEAHITEGLLAALAAIEQVVRIIRESRDQDAAAAALQDALELTEVQARAILALRLGRLTALESQELEDRLTELRALIHGLEQLLRSERRRLDVLLEELDEIVAGHGDARRTTIVEDVDSFEVEDITAEESVVVMLSHENYIKRAPVAQYRRRAQSGRAAAGMDRQAEDFLEHVFVAGTGDTLLFFTEAGQAHALAVRDVPEAGPSSRGRALAQVLPLGREQRVAALLPVTAFDADRSLLFLTARGTVKRTTLDQYANVRASGIAAIRIAAGDRLVDVQPCAAGNDIALVTRMGRAIRFPESEVPATGRATLGVRGVQLRKGDGAIGLVIVRRDATLCVVTELGYAKRTPIGDYPVQKRGGLGTITLDVSARTGLLVSGKEVVAGEELMIITADGVTTRVRADDIPEQGRATQGRQVVKPTAGDRIVEVARVAREAEDERAARTARAAASPAGSAAGADQLDLIG